MKIIFNPKNKQLDIGMRFFYLSVLCIMFFGTLIDKRLASAEEYFQSHVLQTEMKIYNHGGRAPGFSNPIWLRQNIKDILQKKPASFVAHFVSGRLEYEIGNYPTSVYHLKKARYMIERLQGFDKPPKSGEPHWHALILYQTAKTYMAMDRIKSECEILDLYLEKDYKRYERINRIRTSGSWYYIRGLLKMGEIQKAHQLSTDALAQPGMMEKEKQSAMMDLKLVEEFQSRSTKDTLNSYLETYEQLKASKRRVDSFLLNTLAYYCRINGDLEKAERFLKLSAEIRERRSASHPCNTLSRIYVASSKWGEARASLKNEWQWISGKYSFVGKELRKETLLSVSEYYIATGCPERALQICLPLVDIPVRSGFRWRFPEQWDAALLLTTICAYEQTRLRLSQWEINKSIIQRAQNIIQKMLMRLKEEQLKRIFKSRVAGRLSRKARVLNVTDIIDAPYWMHGDAIRILGPSVTRKLIKQYPFDDFQKQLYQNAVEAEVYYLEHAWDQLEKTSAAALSDLPGGERLWRARMSAMNGVCLMKSGEYREAMNRFLETYHISPAIFDHLNIPLPCRIYIDENNIVKSVASMIQKSSRIVFYNQGFKLWIKKINNHLEFVLKDRQNQPLKRFFISNRDMDHLQLDENILPKFYQQIFSVGDLPRVGDFDLIEGRSVENDIFKSE